MKKILNVMTIFAFLGFCVYAFKAVDQGRAFKLAKEMEQKETQVENLVRQTAELADRLQTQKVDFNKCRQDLPEDHPQHLADDKGE
jgi:hypothetical protein